MTNQRMDHVWKGEIRQIQDICCEVFNISRIDLLSHRRSHDISAPRQIAFYLVRHLTGATFPTMGRQFGARDHTTIMAGVKNARRLMDKDASLRDKMLIAIREFKRDKIGDV